MAEFKFVANITDRHGNPLIGVDVEAIDVNLFTVDAPDPMQYVVAIVKTDISGTATFTGLPIGMYYARPRINREDVRVQVQTPSGMGGGGKMCYAALVQKDGLGSHTTIQAAVTALGTGGGAVFICAGTYTENVTVAGDTANLWLIGAARAEVIIVGNFSVQAVDTGAVENFRMEHLTLNGNAGTALYFNSVAGGQPIGVELRDLYIINATIGIDMSDLNGGFNWVIDSVDMASTVTAAGQLEVILLDISNCRFGVSGLGLYIGGATACSDVKVSNCTFNGGSTYALRLLNVIKLVLGNCRFVTIGASGILLGNNGTIVISDSTFDITEGAGIDADPAVIAGLTLENLQLVCATPQTVDRKGIEIGDNVSELVISGCRIKNFESYGIALGLTQHYIIGNTVIINGGDTHSIYLGGADYGVVSGCNLSGTAGAATTYGIYGAAGTTNTVVVANNVRNHDDLTNLVNGTDSNIVGGNNPTGGGGVAFHAPVTLAADAAVLLDLNVQEIQLDSQNPNLVFAGPATAPAADPTFRSLVDADIPAAIARDAEVTAAIGTHEAAADPHPGYQTPAEHTAIGDGAPHHAAVTIGADGEHSLAGQVLSGVAATAAQAGHATAAQITKLDGIEAGADATPDATTLVKGKVQLAGQLGGTAALPTVTGLTETAGPTALVLGAIADGQFLKRVGATVVGAAGGGGGDVATDVIWDALGDTLYGTGANTGVKLGGNITTTRKFLRQVGDGAISAAPAWDVIADADVPATHSASSHAALPAQTGSIVPNVDSAIDLGSSAPKYWANVYADKLWINSTATLNGATAGVVNVTGDMIVSARLSIMGSTLFEGIFCTISPTRTTVAATEVALSVNPIITLGASYYNYYAISGLAKAYGASGGIAQKIKGLTFNAAAYAQSVTSTFSELIGCEVYLTAWGLLAGGALTVTAATVFKAAVPAFNIVSGGTLAITTYKMFDGVNPASAKVVNAYGLYINDVTLATTINRILELGPTPYLRLLGSGEWTPAANRTPLYVAEGATPTLRQLRTFDPGNLGVNFTAGQLVVVAV